MSGNLRPVFHRHKRTFFTLVFLVLYSVTVSYAVPPTTKYQPGETLDPNCIPGSSNCTVQILPDQTGHAGEYLTTDGNITTWTAVVSGYTNEEAQDAAASLIQNGTGISWSYSDVGNTLTPTVTLAPFSTTNLSEGSNLYYTSARFDTAFAAKTTTSLAEGSNLYFTDERAQDGVGGALSAEFTYNDAGNSIAINSILWSKISSTPTTLSGYGIIDALSSATSSTQNGYFGDINIQDDVNPSNYLTITNAEDLSTGRTLSIITGDANRTVTFAGNATISGINSGDVALSGENYLSLSGQAITVAAVNLSGTHVTGTLAAARFPALAGDVATTAGSLTTTIQADAVALTTDTTGNYVATISGGAGLTGSGSTEGSTPTLAVVSANGAIVINADDVALTLAASADGVSATTSSGSGLEIISSGLALIQGCADNQILKWNEGTDSWNCSADASGGGAGNSFETISTPSGTNPVADASTDTLTLTVSDNNLVITGTAGSDTIDFDISESTLAGAGLSANSSALDVNVGNGLQIATDAIALGALSADWNQTGAFDIVLNNASSEFKILESAGATFFGILNVGDLAADAEYTFSGSSGTVLTTSNYTATLDATYVNVAENPTAGDISGSFSGGLNVAADSIALTTDTTGNYVATISGGAGLTGSGSTEGSTPTLAVVSANGAIVINADDVALTLAASADALSATTSSASGMEILSSGLSLLQGCANNEVLRWNETTDLWACSATASGTVTTFSSGDLSPLFTTSVSNATTTPALSFALSNAGANTYFGNGTGSTATPSFTAAGALTKTDDTNVTLTLGGSAATALLNSTSLTLGWTGQLSVARGGTGAANLTTNGVLYGNATSAIAATNAGTNGQIFLGVTGGAPQFATLSNDATITNTGVLTISSDSVALSTDTTGNYIATITGGGGLTGSGSSEGSTPTLAVVSGNGAIIVNADDITFTLAASADALSATTSSASGMEILSSGLSLLQGCADNQILKWSEGTDTWGCSNDASGGGAGNSFETISTPSGTNPVADASTDTLTLAVTGTNLIITGDSSSDTIDFDISESTLAGSGIVANSSALDVNVGNGIQIASDAVALGILSADWNQTGAFDIVLNNASSEFKVLESAGATFFGTLDIGDLAADATYTFSGTSGTVLTTSNYTGTLDSVYVNVGESPTSADISGSFSGGLTIAADAVALTTDTTGNYVATISGGAGLTGSGSTEGSTPTLAVVSGNGGIVANTDDITLTLATSSDALSATTSSASGMEILSSGLSLLQGCSNGQILKWNETTDLWACGADNDTGVSDGDKGDITVASSGTVWTIDADSVALGTDTTGNYVATLTNGLGISGSSSTEGGTPTIALDVSAALAGDHTLSANEEKFGQSGIVFEGSTADTIETYFAVTDPTSSDKTITFPDASGTVILSGHTFNSDVTATLGTGGTTALTIASNAVALGTDTTGNYVATISGGAGLTGSGSTEGSTPTLAVVSGNGAIIVNADDITFTLAASADALSATTSSASGMEILSSGLSLLQGCADNQILKWSEGTDTWGCGVDNEISDGDKGDIVVSGSGTTWNIDTDVIDWADIADATTLDASTSIGFGAGALSLTFTNNGSGDEIHNLSSTGDFVIQDNGAAFATFTDGGNVGIGTSTPATKLHVYKSTPGDYVSQITMEEGQNDGYAQISFVATGREWHFGVGGAGEGVFGVANKFYIWDQQASAMRFKINTLGQIEIPNASLTNDGGLFDVNVTLGDDGNADVIAGINVNVTSAATGDADTVYGIHITNVASPDGAVLERAIRIGSGWDEAFDVNGTLISLAELQALDGGIDLTTETNGNYVATISGGAGLTGSGSTEGSTPTLAVVSANGAIVINADDVALTLAASADALSATTSSASGMEILSSGLSLLQGCSNGQILKWNETTDLWACGADNDTGVSDGDKGDITVASSGTVWTIDADSVALGTDTTGNYVQSITNGSGIGGGNGGSEGAALTLALGALTADWNQSGAFDVTLNNAASELKILESSGATFYGIFDVGDLSSADKTYTFPDRSGTVSLSGDTFTTDVTGTLDASGATALTIASDAVTFAKFQNITDNKLLGRSAGTNGDMQEITIGSGITLSGGTLSLATNSTAYIQNQVASEQTAGFRVNGNGIFNGGKVFIGQATGTYNLDVLNATTGQTATNSVSNFYNAGSSFDTTGGNIFSYAGDFNSNSTESAGSNMLTNVGLRAVATGGDASYGIVAEGDTIGISATSATGTAVSADSSDGIALAGTSANGIAVYSLGKMYSSDNVYIGVPSIGSAYRLEVVKDTTGQTASTRVVSVSNSSATFNTTSGALSSYGGYFESISTRSSGSNDLTNVGLYATASGAQNNYAAIFDAGNVGIGDSTPASLFTVGSGDLFQVNSSGTIIAGSISSGFGAIDVGADNITTTGTVFSNDFDRSTAGALTFGNTNATSISLCNSTSCDTLSIGTNADADAINIGDSLDTITMTGASASAFVLNGVNVSAAEFNVLDAGIALGTDTTGNYVANTQTSALTGLTGGSAGSVGASLTLGFDYSQALSGDVGLAANATVFGQSGIVFEGSTADTIETYFAVTDPTSSDKTITFPDLSGTIALQTGAFTTGSAVFANSSGQLAQDNDNFFWDDSNNRLGIGTATPDNLLDIETNATAKGLRITSTVSGNAGVFEIYPNASPIGTPADFQIANVGRLNISSYALIHTGLGGMTLSGAISATTATFTGLTINATTLSLLSASNSVDKSIFWGGGKSAVFFSPVGSWNRDNFSIALSSTADLTAATTADTKLKILNSSGFVGIGANITPSARLHVIDTTEQLRLGYDTSNYLSATINSTGSLTLNLTGTSPEFTFSDPINVPDEAYGAGWDGNTEVPTKNALYDKIEAIPALTDGDKGEIVVFGSGTTWGIDANVINFSHISDVMSLDASTSINFSGTNTLTFTNNGSADEIHNLSATGDFVIQDNGTAFATFTDGGSTVIGTVTDNATFNNGGDLQFSGTGDYLVGDDRYAFRYAGDEDAGLVFNTTVGTFDYRNGVGTVIFRIDAGNGKTSLGNSTSTDGSFLDVNAALGGDSDVDTLSGINVDVTSAATGDADLLYGLNIANLTGADATVLERAINIGTGWDVGIQSAGNYVQSAGTMSLTSANTTQTTTSSIFAMNGNSLTSGTGFYGASSTLSSGSLVDLAVTGTAAASNTQKVLNISTSGANATSTQTTYGAFVSNSHTGTSHTNYAGYFTATGSGTTSNNIGLYATASGGTNNYAAVFDAGNVGIGTTTPATKLHVYKSTAADYTSQITMQEGQADGYAQISFVATGREWHFGVGGGSESAFSVANKFYIWDQQAGAMRFKIDTLGQVELPGITLTDTGSQFDVNMTLGNDSAADTVAGINVDITSAATGDADVLSGITINNLSSGNATVLERGLIIGTGWSNAAGDADISFQDTDPVIRLGATDNTGILRIVDSNSTPQTLLEVRDYATNVGGLVSAGAFIGNMSYMSEEFNTDMTTGTTGDSETVVGDNGTLLGTTGNWYFDTTGATVTFSQSDQIGGFARLATGTTSGVAGLIGFGTSQNDLSLIFSKANLPIVQMKVRTGSTAATNDVVWGLSSVATATGTNDTLPTDGMFFWGNNGTSWVGVVRSGGSNVGTVTCPGSISTTQFATGRIQVESATSVRFLIDNDASDGVQLSDCGTVSGANPTAALGVVFYAINTTTTSVNNDIDYVRIWQDDAADASGTAGNEPPMIVEQAATSFDAKMALTELITANENVEYDSNSKLSIQVLYASKGVVTGELAADRVLTNTITSANEDGTITMILPENGVFAMGQQVTAPDGEFEPQTSARITFHGNGNAEFAGKITASEIEAGKITGLETITNQISLLSQGQEALTLTASALDALAGALGIVQTDIDTLKTGATATSEVLGLFETNLGELATRTETLEAFALNKNLADLESVTSGALTVNHEARFTGNAIFDGSVTFGAAEFTMPPIFNKDSAGFAIIHEGDRRVEIVFDEEYLTSPVVNTSIAFDTEDDIDDNSAASVFASGIQSIIVDTDVRGFTILLNKPATRDLRFSWTALAVKDPHLFESIFEGLTLDENMQEEVPEEILTPPEELPPPPVEGQEQIEETPGTSPGLTEEEGVTDQPGEDLENLEDSSPAIPDEVEETFDTPLGPTEEGVSADDIEGQESNPAPTESSEAPTETTPTP